MQNAGFSEIHAVGCLVLILNVSIAQTFYSIQGREKEAWKVASAAVEAKSIHLSVQYMVQWDI